MTRMWLGLAVGIGVAAMTMEARAEGPSWTGSTQPQGITGGTEVDACGWPSVVALTSGGDVFCTGSLVHPRVVLTAAHCLSSQFPTEIAFGSDGLAPVASVGVERCDWHPAYDGSDGTEGSDVAYCVLSQSVSMQVVPPAMGCETEALSDGQAITIVGYGSTSASYNPEIGWEWVDGVGPKRVTVQTLEQVYLDTLFLLGIEGSSACPGDSGGPALVQLADGSWRTLGAGSRLHPDSPFDNENDCGYGALYSTFAHVMPWIEDEAGFDITPCHDADGTWNPDERCTGFPLAPGDAGMSSGTWDDGCRSTALSGPVATCGEPFAEEPSGTSTGDVSDESSSGGDESSSSSEPGTDGGSTSDASPDDDATTSTGTGEAPDLEATEGDDGCGCRQRGGTPGGWLVLVAGVMLRRRTRRERAPDVA